MVWVCFPADVALRCFPPPPAAAHRPQRPRQPQQGSSPKLSTQPACQLRRELFGNPPLPSHNALCRLRRNRAPASQREGEAGQGRGCGGVRLAWDLAALPASRHSAGKDSAAAPRPRWVHPSSDTGCASCPGELCSEEVSWEPLLACFPSQTGVLSRSECF